ncbi:MAG: ABC transporter ATP-binding protein [Proteobacteria bacterium]|nr:ABC transporter ATP-binding protein [Pseudomonadota bacterium]MBU1710663.1 ABC transporter ATP-binding protein [Pseudomonadota bacterium]
MVDNTQRIADPAQYSLVIKNITKQYKGAPRPALAGLDIAIRQGEIFGLLGPNGAGKTTAISIMSTLLRPDSGTVSICGVDALAHPGKVRNLISLVPQHIALYLELTARENLNYFGRLFGLKGSDLKIQVEEALVMVGLENRADQQIYTYSGGMKRRANLAVGVLNRPRVLFLDEPTVGIDAQSRNLILEKLQHLRDSGTTMVYTTHYMEEAQALCSSVLVIDQGQMVACGRPTELIDQQPDCANLEDLFFHLTGKNLRD